MARCRTATRSVTAAIIRRVDASTIYMADAARKGRIWSPGLSGESHPAAKLTESDVLEIRAAEGMTQSALATRYGVSRSLVGQIRTGKVWAWLA